MLIIIIIIIIIIKNDVQYIAYAKGLYVSSTRHARQANVSSLLKTFSTVAQCRRHNIWRLVFEIMCTTCEVDAMEFGLKSLKSCCSKSVRLQSCQ